ncbi:hypothetical protein [Streptomyces coeruleorubidus]|uniref:hypothetical protein n=1 Tax=Streptomyces coeruleorubidus TaxID=116188 RepID=UPI0036BB0BAA
MSPTPLVLRSARQAVTATFSAGASVGFLASRHGTRLVLAAGRVTDPRPFPEDEDAYLPDMSGD